jgi:hypothetical protein
MLLMSWACEQVRKDLVSNLGHSRGNNPRSYKAAESRSGAWGRAAAECTVES